MLTSTRRAVWSGALLTVLGLLAPAMVRADHGAHGNPSTHANHGPTHTDVRQQHTPPAAHNHGGPLSYNSYWKAAVSPNPPRTNQDNNRYWQKMQAWQEYQQRQKK